MNENPHSSFVAEAAAIADSGRWEGLNDRIEQLARHPGEKGEWWVRVFSSLSYRTFSEYILLKKAYENRQHNDASLLAWRARNLLELSIWSTYCSVDKENARRFYEDAGRDVRGVFDAFLTWGAATNQLADWVAPIKAAKWTTEQEALDQGIESLDGGYKAVAAAAEECGLRNHFAVSNKFLSKFAHPTAMQILALRDPEKEALQRDVFFGEGCLFFLGSFNALERQLTK